VIIIVTVAGGGVGMAAAVLTEDNPEPVEVLSHWCYGTGWAIVPG
jgi:hypothetical protein